MALMPLVIIWILLNILAASLVTHLILEKILYLI